MEKKILLTLVGICLFLTGFSQSLDTNFDTDGKKIMDLSGNEVEPIDMVVLSNNDLLFAGRYFNGANYDVCLVKLSSTGNLVTGFDGDGAVIFSVGTGNDIANRILLQPDGKILLCGSTESGTNYDFFVARLNSDGTLDATFDSDGIVVFPIGTADDEANSMVLQPDGKIIVIGSTESVTGYNDYGVARLNSDGAFDTGFNGTGKIVHSFSTNNDYPRSVGLQSTGKIIIYGSKDYMGTAQIIRLNTDGSLDGSFSYSNNNLFIDSPKGCYNLLIVEPDDQILFASNHDAGTLMDNNWAVIHLNADGTLDNGFDSDGIRIFNHTDHDFVSGLHILNDGNIVVTGCYASTSSLYNYGAVKITSDGSSITGFNAVNFDLQGNNPDFATCSGILSDTKIIVGGFTNVIDKMSVICLNNLPVRPSAISGNTSPCKSSHSYSVTSVPGVTYNWTVSGGGTITGGGGTNAITINWTATSGPYTITVYASNSSGNSTTRTLSINPVKDPVINSHPDIYTDLCTNGSKSLNVNVDFATTYQWQVNSGSGYSDLSNSSTYTNVTTGNMQINNPTMAMSMYDYRCKISNSCGVTIYSNASTLVINHPVTITSQPVNDTACYESFAGFSIAATGNIDSYQWQVKTVSSGSFQNITDNWRYSGATSNSLSISNTISLSDGDEYRCIISATCSPYSITSSVAKLKLKYLTINSSPTSQTVCANSGHVFNVTTAESDLSYQWEVNPGTGYTNVINNTSYSGATTSSLTLSNITASQTNYLYRCHVYSSCDTEYSNEATLIVQPSVPGAGSLLTPANAATAVPISPALTWGAFSNASTYVVEVSTNAGFTAIVHTSSSLAATNYNVPIALNTSTSYYWRVKASNICGTGSYSSAFSFTTASSAAGCYTFSSTDVPKLIDGGNPSTVYSEITVPANLGVITSITVTNLNGSHSYMGDLSFALVDPTGYSVALIGQQCGSLDGFNLDFSDAASSSFSSTCPSVTVENTYLPSSPLSSFNGLDPAGIWTLVIDDGYSGDGGQLDQWELHICTGPPPNFTIVTEPASSITSTTAVIAANVTDDGGLSTTAWGVVYSTYQNPTTSDNVCTDFIFGFGADFFCSLTGLTPFVTYYARAFFINSAGVHYGNQISFTAGVASSVTASEMLDKNLSVYPNPTEEKFTLKISNPDLSDAELKLTTIEGTVLHRETLKGFSNDYEKSFNMNSYSKGMYYIHLTTSDGRVVCRKIIYR